MKDSTCELKIIALGGLGEIGKNMMLLEYGEDILIIDAGLAFPDEDLLGVDLVIPNMSYITEHRDKIRGLVVTHGHEDHVGALPYLLREVRMPIYATDLTLGLIRSKLDEHQLSIDDLAHPVTTDDSVSIGPFDVQFFVANHSIAAGVGLAIDTPAGLVVHSGDFKFDHTPIDGQPPEFGRLAALGDRGVLALLCDSTNAERPGYTGSERLVGLALDDVFRQARRRVLVTSFASHLHRIQQVLDVAARHRRRVAVVGRSMERTIDVALELGYINAPPGIWVDADEIRQVPPDRIAILTTGSQGEPLSALTRISNDDHRLVSVVPGDTVVIAATPVPGNERLVNRTIDNLYRLGAEVVYGKEAGVHVSGHASEEELKLLLGFTRPAYLIPIHGEYRHLVKMGELGESMGMSSDQILVGENGTVFSFQNGRGSIAGKVNSGRVLVDGLGVGDVGNVVLRDRHQLAQHGVVVVVVSIAPGTGKIVSGPEIISRGFVYMRESDELLAEARRRVIKVIQQKGRRDRDDLSATKSAVREALSGYFYDRTKRRPVVLPVVLEA